MKKIIGILLAVVFLFVVGVVKAAPETPAPAYYIHSENPALMALFGVSHRFPGVFSSELSPNQLAILERLGIKTESVQIFEITGKPTCDNDGICEPESGENPSCADCKNGEVEPTPTPTPGERNCYPTSPKPWGIDKVNGGSGGAGVTVAVLDTGVNQNHPDLKANIKDCVSEVTHFKPDKGNCEDAHGHGTHVSGTVLANGGADNLGIYGVAPEADLTAVKVCDRRGWCYGDDMAAGIRYAADRGVNIISMSISGNSPDPQVIAAIDYAVGEGVLVVAAAGNDGPADGSIDYPGAYFKVVAVGAIDSLEQVASWSSRGINNGDYVIEEREVEFGTPGVNVESTANNGCYTYMSGTSMATPHISGLGAKLWQGSASSTRSYLQSIARDIWETGDDTATGFGLPIAP